MPPSSPRPPGPVLMARRRGSWSIRTPRCGALFEARRWPGSCASCCAPSSARFRSGVPRASACHSLGPPGGTRRSSPRQGANRRRRPGGRTGSSSPWVTPAASSCRHCPHGGGDRRTGRSALRSGTGPGDGGGAGVLVGGGAVAQELLDVLDVLLVAAHHVEQVAHRADLLDLLLDEPLHELVGCEVVVLAGHRGEGVDLV